MRRSGLRNHDYFELTENKNICRTEIVMNHCISDQIRGLSEKVEKTYTPTELKWSSFWLIEAIQKVKVFLKGER